MTDEVAPPTQHKFPLDDLWKGLGGLLIGLLFTDFSTNVRLFFVLMGIANLLGLGGWYLDLQQRGGTRRVIRFLGLGCWGVAVTLIILHWFKLEL